MEKFECNIVNISRDFESGQAVITMTASPSVLSELEKILNKRLDCKFSKHNDKRSTNANSFMWALITKLQEEMQKDDPHITKDDIYKDYIKQYGRSKEYELPTEAVPTLVGAWNKNGLGWFTEEVDVGEERSIIRFYYGSSSYGKKRMSILIDAILQDCKALGIGILPSDKLEDIDG